MAATKNGNPGGPEARWVFIEGKDAGGPKVLAEAEMLFPGDGTGAIEKRKTTAKSDRQKKNGAEQHVLPVRQEAARRNWIG